MGLGVLFTAFFTILSVEGAKISSGLFVAARILEGCAEVLLSIKIKIFYTLITITGSFVSCDD